MKKRLMALAIAAATMLSCVVAYAGNETVSYNADFSSMTYTESSPLSIQNVQTGTSTKLWNLSLFGGAQNSILDDTYGIWNARLWTGTGSNAKPLAVYKTGTKGVGMSAAAGTSGTNHYGVLEFIPKNTVNELKTIELDVAGNLTGLLVNFFDDYSENSHSTMKVEYSASGKRFRSMLTETIEGKLVDPASDATDSNIYIYDSSAQPKHRYKANTLYNNTSHTGQPYNAHIKLDFSKYAATDQKYTEGYKYNVAYTLTLDGNDVGTYSADFKSDIVAGQPLVSLGAHISNGVAINVAFDNIKVTYNRETSGTTPVAIDTSSGNIKATVNLADKTGSAKAILAIFNTETNQFVGTEVMDINNVQAGETVTFTKKPAAGETAKVFIWSGLDTIAPLHTATPVTMAN